LISFVGGGEEDGPVRRSVP